MMTRHVNSLVYLCSSKDGIQSCSNNIKSLKVNENEIETFHTKKGEEQLYRQARQVLDHIAVKSPSAIIGHTVKFVSCLEEKANKQCLQRALSICRNCPAGPLPDQSV